MNDPQQTITATVTNAATGATNDVIVDLASGSCVSGEAMDSDTAAFFGAFGDIAQMMADDPDIDN